MLNHRRKLKADPWLEAGINYLRLAAVAPSKTKDWKQYWFIFPVLFNLSSVLLLTYSMYIYMNDLDKLANILHHWLLMLDVVILALHYRRRWNITANLLSEMATTFQYGDWLAVEAVEEFEMRRTDNNKTAVRGLWLLTIYTFINISTFGLFEKYMEDTEFLFFPCWAPFTLEGLNYFLFLFWQVCCAITTIFLIFGILAVQYFTYSFFYFEIEVLLFALKRLRVIDKNINMKVAVRECAFHHQSIIKSFTDFHKVLGVINFFVLTSGVATMTISGLALISDNTSVRIKFIGIMITELVFLYICCRLSQDIYNISSKVKDACYETDWMTMDKYSIKTLQIMTEQAFRPMIFKSVTGHHLSLDVYMNMVKASYSYFNMLLTQK